MKVLFCFAVLFGAISNVHAESHSAVVCSKSNISVCAHLGFHWGEPDSSSEAKFIFHATPQTGEIKELNLDLWMDMGSGHGHSSAPLNIQQMEVNKYLVTNAYFVMPGTWLVRANFSIDSEPYHLEIPVEVKQ